MCRRKPAAPAAGVYKQRHPEKTAYYAVFYHHYDQFKAEYDTRFAREYGPWRAVVDSAVKRFPRCGVLEEGFARARCSGCGAEFLLAFSCKKRCICASCSAKRTALWAEFVRERVVRPVLHRHAVFTIPKIVRPYFRFHRELLADLCRCAWTAIKTYVLESLEEDVLPAAILTIHTSGQFLNFNPHIHGLVVSGGFRADGSFIECPAFDRRTIGELFAAGVFSLLRGRGLISRDLVDKVMCWRHSGFDAYFGPPIPSLEETVTVGLYIVRPPVAASRLVLDDGPVVRYFAKGTVPGKDTQGLFDPESRTFDYLEWMARVTSHIPERGSHLVHYLGAYSNKHRACELAGATESACTPVGGSEPISASAWREARRRSWARLIQRVWQTNPLICGKCGGQMKIIAFIDAKDQPEVVAAILGHIKWRFEVLPLPARPPPLAYSEEPAGVATDYYHI